MKSALTALSEYTTFGFLCHVDLFAEVSDSAPASSARQQYPFQPSVPISMNGTQWSPPGNRGSFPSADSSGMSYGPGVPSMPFDVRSAPRPDYARTIDLSTNRGHDPWSMRSKPYTGPSSASSFGHHRYSDENKCTELLSGETVVPCSLVDYGGRKAAMFAFPVRASHGLGEFGANSSSAESSPTDPQDLAVKKEGRFVLRYRAFNIQSKIRDDGVVSILAECFGGPFEVYSTKSFPGLQASTELTRVSFICIGSLDFHSLPV